MKLNINDKAIKNSTTKYINNIIDDVEKPYIYRNKKYSNYPFSVIKKSTNKKIIALKLVIFFDARGLVAVLSILESIS